MKVTEIQKQFVLNFFKNEKYVGWKNIAEQLIDKGTCVVAGKEPIWRGGVGNYIKVKESEGFIDCLVYTFDIQYFLSSAWVKDCLEDKIRETKVQIDHYTEKHNELKELMKY
jgi:hypothetical protein